MAVNNLLVRSYATNIYIYGNRSFATIPAEYHGAVKQHAAQTYSLSQIDNALANGWITETEYNETLSLATPQES
jgi:hypothetical protein